MARVTGFTAERMLEIEKKSVVSGSVDANHNLTFKTRGGETLDGGSLAVTPQLRVEDTTSVDLTLTGSGTVANPWVLKADVKEQSVNGILEASFFNGHEAKVKIEGQSNFSGPYNLAFVFDVQGPRRVRLERYNNTYVITGQIPDYERRLTLGPNWVIYSRAVVESTFNDDIKAVQLKSGLVVLSGLLTTTSTGPVDGSLIAKLPADLAPDVSIVLPVLMGDSVRTVRIWPNGDITAWGNFPGSTYLSLDGLCFFPKSANIPWTVVGQGGSSFSAAAEAFNDVATWGETKFYKDEYGHVWFQGWLRLKTAITADNTNLIVMPSTHRTAFEQHFRGAAASGDAWCGLGGNADGLNWKLNSPSNIGNLISITGVVFTTVDAFNSNPYSNLSYLANGWAFHAIRATVVKREDGLCLGGGLLIAGSLSTRAARLEREYWPRTGRIIMASISNNGNARVDLSARTDIESTQPGALKFTLGSNWFSLDALQWIR